MEANILDGVITDTQETETPQDGIKKEITIPDGVITEPLFFDLETVPDRSREHLFGLEELPEIKRPRAPNISHEEILCGSITDVEQRLDGINPSQKWIDGLLKLEEKSEKPRAGVKKAIAKLRKDIQARHDAVKERNKKLSVTPEFCRICAFGFAIGDDEALSMFADDDVSETELLITFWLLVKNLRAPLVGYNIINFDLPVIYVRSIILGVTPSRNFDLKPWGKDIYDLMKKRFPSGGQMGMKDVARIYKLDVPAGDCEGSQVLELFDEGTDEAKKKLLEYVESDVVVSQQLYNIWNRFFK